MKAHPLRYFNLWEENNGKLLFKLKMILSNIHTHSVFSDGKSTIEENAESAIAKGFLLLGISDHSYLEYDHSYTIKTDDYSDYIKAVEEAKLKYKGRIEIRLGIEKDVDSVVDVTPYDYVIGSAHNVCVKGKHYAMDESVAVQRACAREGFGENMLDMCRTYFENVVKAAYMKPDVLAHFDLITKFGLIDTNNAFYRRTALEAIDEIINLHDILIEINTGAISRGYRNLPYPEDFILRRIKERNGKVIIGSDSHYKDNLDYAFPLAVKQLKKAGIKSVYQMTENGFCETEI